MPFGDAETTTNQDRKQLLRAAIEEVQLRSEDDHYAIKVLWKGNAVSERQIPRRRRGQNVHATSSDIVQMVRLLATELDDAQIARVLTKQGRHTGKGNPFSAHKVAQLRNRNGIPVYPRHKARDPKQEGPSPLMRRPLSSALAPRRFNAGYATDLARPPAGPWCSLADRTDRCAAPKAVGRTGPDRLGRPHRGGQTARPVQTAGGLSGKT